MAGSVSGPSMFPYTNTPSATSSEIAGTDTRRHSPIGRRAERGQGVQAATASSTAAAGHRLSSQLLGCQLLVAVSYR